MEEKFEAEKLLFLYFSDSSSMTDLILSIAVYDLLFFKIISIPLPSPHPSSKTSPDINFSDNIYALRSLL